MSTKKTEKSDGTQPEQTGGIPSQRFDGTWSERTDGNPAPVAAVCPGCGGSGPSVRTVAETCADPESRTGGLTDRLARSPGVPSRFDTVLHFIEGMVLVAMGSYLARSGLQNDKPVYTIAGSLLAVALFVGTLAVVRGELRERKAVMRGEPRAELLWRPAHHCSACGAVFYPAGTPWQGALTPEQFQKYVWTEAGYGRQLDKKVKDVALPSAAPTGHGGTPDRA
ncbi:hypothetical protein ACFZC6_04715 [Streptomyces ossamyceticus]|uniref:Uncharacterized protein n=1 Tax=Streptomyces ossamyceticus TaxID=249581 RepID=A0ABV2UQD5_9ACTN